MILITFVAAAVEMPSMDASPIPEKQNTQIAETAIMVTRQAFFSSFDLTSLSLNLDCTSESANGIRLRV